MIKLSISTRDGSVKGSEMRAGGMVPAVFYGPKEQSVSISVSAKQLEKIWKEAGETTIVELDGVGESRQALIHEVQFHPVTGAIIHADFYVPEKGKKVQITVPLEFEGASPAEKQGHILVKAMHVLEIKVSPVELPHHLVVNVGSLVDLHDRILAKDIILPTSGELVTDADEIVVAVTEFKEEKVVATEFKVAEVIGEKEKAAAESASAQEKK